MPRAFKHTILALLLGCGQPKGHAGVQADSGTSAPPHPSVTVAPSVSSDTASSAKVDLFGYYFLNEPIPAWATNIDVLHLSTINVTSSPSDSSKLTLHVVPLWGFIRLKADSNARPVDFHLQTPLVEGRRFTFSTDQVDSVTYDFTGMFLKVGNFPDDPPNGDAVLTGHLRKLMDGRVVGEADVTFRYFGGD